MSTLKELTYPEADLCDTAEEIVRSIPPYIGITGDALRTVCRQVIAADRAARPEALEFELPNAIWLAKFLHEAYERLAPQYGYVTREDTRTFDHQSPNGRLMAAAFEELRSAVSPQLEKP